MLSSAEGSSSQQTFRVWGWRVTNILSLLRKTFLDSMGGGAWPFSVGGSSPEVPEHVFQLAF